MHARFSRRPSAASTQVLFLAILASLMAATPAWAQDFVFQFQKVAGSTSNGGVQGVTGAAALNVPGVFSGLAFLNTTANVAAGVQLNGFPTMNAVAVCRGDVNGDGISDIIVGANDQDPSQPSAPAVANITIVLGNGDGTFGQPSVYTSSSNLTSLACGDVNGDGITGIAVLGSAPDPNNPGSQRAGVRIYTGQSLMSAALGSIVPSQANYILDATLVGSATQPLAVQFGNLDGDGIPDYSLLMYDPATNSMVLLSFLSSGAPLNDSSPFSTATGIAGLAQPGLDGRIRGPRTFTFGSSNLSGAPSPLNRQDSLDVFFADSLGIEVAANDGAGNFSVFNPGGGVISQHILNWGVVFDEVHGFEVNTFGASGGIGQLSTNTPTDDTTLGSGYQTPTQLPLGASIPVDIIYDKGTDRFYLADIGEGTTNGSVLLLAKDSHGNWVVDQTLAPPSQPMFNLTAVTSATHNVFDALSDIDAVMASDPSTGIPGGVVVRHPSPTAGYIGIAIPTGTLTSTSFVASTGTSCQASTVQLTVGASGGGTPSGLFALVVDGQRQSTRTVAGTTFFTVPAMSEGTHEWTTVFQGNSNWAGSNASQTVTILPCGATITGVTPSSGPVGSSATVQGSGFANFGVSSVCLGTVCTNNAQVIDDNNVTFVVSSNMQSGPVAVSGTQGFVTNSGIVFKVDPF